jgi:hypothetical protein
MSNEDPLYAFDHESESWYRIYEWGRSGDGTPVVKAKERVPKDQAPPKFHNCVLGRDFRDCSVSSETNQSENTEVHDT